jgi:NAD(P)-dependent dehydrogenase (short-subunit alcohol dehydrogenase family)
MKKNKIALVTGGSRGLGKDMALQLAKKGLDVILTYNTKKGEAEKVVAEIESMGQNAIAFQLNVSKSSSIAPFFDKVASYLNEKNGNSNFDFLINNAGIAVYAYLDGTTEEQFDELVNVHLKSPYFIAQKAMSHMNEGGGIVNISTGLTRFALPGYAAYASVKGAMEILTKYQAKELGAKKIRVNIVAPGAIATDFGGGVVRDNEQLNQFIASQTALGRVGLADDVAGVVAFLCSEDAKWVNAQRIEVSGGQML